MSCKNDRRRKSFFPKIFCVKQKKTSTRDDRHLNSAEFGEVPVPSPPPSPLLMKTHSGPELGRPKSSEFTSAVPSNSGPQGFRIFVATWNVGGKPPHNGLNLNDFLPADDRSDIYVLGFQEIVPLNAGNVLVIEDSEPAVKWLRLIDRALNGPAPINTYACPYTPRTYNKPSSSTTATTSKASRDSKNSASIFFQKPSLKTISKTFRTEPKRRLKTCNCPSEVSRKYYRDSCFICPQAYINADDSSEEDEEEEPCNFVMTDATPSICTTSNRLRYSLIASKQMVGIFVTVWAKREHAQHIGHLRISTVGCGILGCLGNKGCISVSMSLHQTSFCFVCSHLASGEKEGDELRRNADVIEILKNTQFPRICRSPTRRFPENILGHDRVIWLGDLNYRIALSYTETRKLLDADDWDALLNKDQLKIERESGRVFKGWNEGKIYFAPTYKYSNDSDDYAGEIATKKKRRTPSWCDRILWHGDGIEQLSYLRGESRFSDHRPVCAVFVVEVDGRLKSALSGPNMKVGVEELLPPSSGYMTV